MNTTQFILIKVLLSPSVNSKIIFLILLLVIGTRSSGELMLVYEVITVNDFMDYVVKIRRTRKIAVHFNKLFHPYLRRVPKSVYKHVLYW